MLSEIEWTTLFFFSGHPISFRLFLRYGLITTLLSLTMASLYMWVRYL